MSAVASDPAGPPSRLPGDSRPGRRVVREASYRRALALGTLASGLAHLLLVVLVGSVEVGGRSAPAPPTRTLDPEGLTVVPVDPLDAAPREGTPRRPEQTSPTPRAAPDAPARLPAGEPVVAEEGLTNAERLRPRMGDERLWIDFRDPLRPGARTDRYAEAIDRLRELVRVWLDSLQLSEEQRRRALDWTFGEGDSRWGVSPEGLHLGDITIPIPFGALFQQGGPLGREAEQALRDLRQIRAQDARSEVEEVLEERREEMRKRSREEAERRRQDTAGGGGSDPPP